MARFSSVSSLAALLLLLVVACFALVARSAAAAAHPANPADARYEDEADPEPMSPAEVGVAMFAAMSGVLSPAAIERLTVALSRAPADQIPPGIREEVYLMHQGVNRSFVLYTPTTYNASTPTPLLFNIHSRGINPEIMAAWTAFDWVAEEHGFVIALPRGLNDEHYAGPICCGGNATRDDVGFMRFIVDKVKTLRNIDPRRIYSTGQSNGGFMSHALACQASDYLAATGLSSGSSPWADHEANCRPIRPVPILSFHGRRDTLVPYAGMVATIANWRVLNRCTDESVITLDNGVSICESWTNCLAQSDGTPTNITICTAENVGRTWVPVMLNGGFAPGEGSREIWRFVSQYRL